MKVCPYPTSLLEIKCEQKKERKNEVNKILIELNDLCVGRNNAPNVNNKELLIIYINNNMKLRWQPKYWYRGQRMMVRELYPGLKSNPGDLFLCSMYMVTRAWPYNVLELISLNERQKVKDGILYIAGAKDER